MEFEITRMELQPNAYGQNDIIIKQVKVTDDDGNYIKFAKLNEQLLDALKEKKLIHVKQ